MRAKWACKKVLTSVWENQAAWDLQHEMPHKIVGIATGGGSCCIRVAAALRVFADFGLTHPFTVLNASSGAGGPVVGYLSGHADQTIGIMEYLLTHKLLYMEKKYKTIPVIRLNTKLYEEIPTQHLDKKGLQAHPSICRIIAAKEDGSIVLLDPKKCNAARAIVASSALWPACDGIEINGDILYDAIFTGQGLPIESALEILGDLRPGQRPQILVFQSRLHPKHRPMEARIWPWVVSGLYFQWTAQLKENLRKIDENFLITDEKFKGNADVDYGRIAPTPDGHPNPRI